jgi:DNA-binding MarR family transcriptional regulator
MQFLHKDTTLMNIAKKLGTTKQTANKLISSLAKKGYVHTVPSKLDKRAINIEISSVGKWAIAIRVMCCREVSISKYSSPRACTLLTEYLEMLTSRQHMTLIAIAHLPTEDTTLMNIAKKLGTTKQTANKLISSLALKNRWIFLNRKLTLFFLQG